MSRAPGAEPAGPMGAGGMLALASAVAFGATTPFVQRFGRGIGPFATAALLYAGAALFSAIPRARREPALLRTGDLPRLAAVATLGAVVAPVALAWGLQRTSGVSASLLLNLEAVFTVLLARALWAEPIGGRSGAALLAMTAGGGLLVASGQASSPGTGLGALAVIGATLAWAADNAVGRPLADSGPDARRSGEERARSARIGNARGRVWRALAAGCLDDRPRGMRRTGLRRQPHALPSSAAGDRRRANRIDLRGRSVRRGHARVGPG